MNEKVQSWKYKSFWNPSVHILIRVCIPIEKIKIDTCLGRRKPRRTFFVTCSYRRCGTCTSLKWILKKNWGIMTFFATILGCFILFHLGDSMSISQLEEKVELLEKQIEVSNFFCDFQTTFLCSKLTCNLAFRL